MRQVAAIRWVGAVALIAALSAAAGETSEQGSGVDVAKLERILKGNHRKDGNRERDRYRHPVETLEFFEVAPDMTVVEIFPATGWYTEILAPYLRGEGKLYAAGFDQATDIKFYQRINEYYQKKLDEHPDVYDEVVVTELNPPEKTRIAPPGSADRVLTFRNVHNWMKAGYAEGAFDAFYQALTPGGILGVVEHRGDPDTEQDPKAKSGYVNQQYVIDMAEEAGFEFLASSEINANPKDTKDYPMGVWTLPPTLRYCRQFEQKAQENPDKAESLEAKAEECREKYEPIGESDRMTLKFRKPEAASAE